MILKYNKPWKIINFVLLAVIKSLQIVFVAYLFKLFINFAQKPKGSLINLSFFAIVGLLVFGAFGIMYQVAYAKLVENTNVQIKKIVANYIINTPNKLNLDSSFMTNDLKQLETNRINSELQIIFSSIQFLSAIISAVITSPILALVFLITSFLPGFIQKLFGSRIENSSLKWQKSNSKYTSIVNESITGNDTIRLYDSESNFINRLISSAKVMEQALMKTNKTKEIAGETITAFAYIFSMIMPFSLGIYLVTQGNITLGSFMMIAQLANNFINPIINIFGQINDIKTTTAISEKVKDISNFNTINSTNLSEHKNFDTLEIINGSLSLKDYLILKNLSFSIKKGQKVLVQAPSGSGKTTLLNVLVGKYSLTNGEYLFNEENVNGNWEYLHSYFSFINQKAVIFEDTIEFNITLGKKISKDKLKKIVQDAGLKKLIAEKGLDYNVGLDGKNLSGGQNQRIEIARALLANRPIILADEMTASLDKNLSRDIHKKILLDFKGTVIEVAHKVSKDKEKYFNQKIELSSK